MPVKLYPTIPPSQLSAVNLVSQSLQGSKKQERQRENFTVERSEVSNCEPSLTSNGEKQDQNFGYQDG